MHFNNTIIRPEVKRLQNNDLQNKDDLKIVKITTDKSSSVKRYRAKARGRAGAFDRPTSHLVIEVDEEGI